MLLGTLTLVYVSHLALANSTIGEKINYGSFLDLLPRNAATPSGDNEIKIEPSTPYPATHHDYYYPQHEHHLPGYNDYQLPLCEPRYCPSKSTIPKPILSVLIPLAGLFAYGIAACYSSSIVSSTVSTVTVNRTVVTATDTLTSTALITATMIEVTTDTVTMLYTSTAPLLPVYIDVTTLYIVTQTFIECRKPVFLAAALRVMDEEESFENTTEVTSDTEIRIATLPATITASPTALFPSQTPEIQAAE